MYRKLFEGLILAIALAATPPTTFGQEVSPFIVEGPAISRTSFTNWERIELTYTVRYLNGYKPALESMKTGSMNFGVLEPDPAFGDELEVRNQRSLGEEHYFDIVYHLRYIAEKKDEIIIPGQKFPYLQLSAGKNEAELIAKYFVTAEFKLAYRTVLTSDADDIKDQIDFGSFTASAWHWKLSAGIVLVGGLFLAAVLVFRKPVLVMAEEGAASGEDVTSPVAATDPLELLRLLEEKVAKAKEQIRGENPDWAGIRSALGAICDDLRAILLVMVPGVSSGTINGDVAVAAAKMQPIWIGQHLFSLTTTLKELEKFLYQSDNPSAGNDSGVSIFLDSAMEAAHDLRPWKIYWHQFWFGMKQRLSRLWRKVRP